MSLDEKLEGWDAALRCLIRKAQNQSCPVASIDNVAGWNDAIQVAHKLIGDARTQKGFVVRECKETRP